MGSGRKYGDREEEERARREMWYGTFSKLVGSWNRGSTEGHPYCNLIIRPNN